VEEQASKQKIQVGLPQKTGPQLRSAGEQVPVADDGPPARASTSENLVPRPLPADAKASAILLSWRRAANVERIVADLRNWKRIGEIIVWNNDGDGKLTLPGATVINSERNFGSLARYGLVPMAANDTIWFQDDDMLINEAQFEKVFAAYAADPTRIYGCRGRNLIDGIYAMNNAYGECDVIVSQTMLFHRSLLHHLFRFLGCIPIPGRADDVAFSLACPSRHVAINVEPVVEVGWDDDNAQWRMPGHVEIRQTQVDMMLRFRPKR
jgi:hypothetical protein